MKAYQIFKKTHEDIGDAESGPKVVPSSDFVKNAHSLDEAKKYLNGKEEEHYIAEYEKKGETTLEKFYEFENNKWDVTYENEYPSIMDEVEVDADLIPGGIGDRTPYESVDAFELLVGALVELEHTKDPFKALEISKDHLVEKKDYYKELITKVEPKFFEELAQKLKSGKSESTLEEAHRWSMAGATKYVGNFDLSIGDGVEQEEELELLDEKLSKSKLAKITFNDANYESSSWVIESDKKVSLKDLQKEVDKYQEEIGIAVEIKVSDLEWDSTEQAESSFNPPKHFNPNAIWFWKSTKDSNYTAQVCRIGDGAGKESFQWTIFKGHKEVMKDVEPSLKAAKQIVFKELGEDKATSDTMEKPKFEAEDQVLMTYNMSVKLEDKILEFLKAHNLEWEAEECITFGPEQECLEIAGTITGKFKDVVAFIKAYHPRGDYRNFYVTKI